MAIGGMAVTDVVRESGTPVMMLDESHVRAAARSYTGAYAATGADTAVYYAGMAGWLVGNFAFYYLNLMVAYDFRDRPKVFRAALLLPVYWVLMSIAAIKAFVQLAFNPNYW